MDIELLIDPKSSDPNIVSHWVTVFGVEWDDNNGDGIFGSTETGSIDVIDPTGGSTGSIDVTGRDGAGWLDLEYDGDPFIAYSLVTEIPEPSSLLLLILAAVLTRQRLGKSSLP